ncbi:hypothetical protein ACT7C6_02420, partial [Bacillus paranthracis]
MFKRKTLAITASLLLFSSISVPISKAAESSTPIESSTNTLSNSEYNFKEIETALYAIENIPNDVLNQGNEEIIQWFKIETGLQVYIENDILKFKDTSQMQMYGFNTTGCISA